MRQNSVYLENKRPVRIAVFASGGGSNARKILENFSGYHQMEVRVLVTNNPHSGVFQFGPSFQVPVELLSPTQYKDGNYLTALLKRYEVDLIILAGYLKLIPSEVVNQFPDRIINIHPALLPHYGGKGMYGMNVHRAVIANGEVQSGITIHYVNERYDEGEIIFRKSLVIGDDWTPEVLQKEVLKLEHQHFSEVIRKVCENFYLENK